MKAQGLSQGVPWSILACKGSGGDGGGEESLCTRWADGPELLGSLFVHAWWYGTHGVMVKVVLAVSSSVWDFSSLSMASEGVSGCLCVVWCGVKMENCGAELVISKTEVAKFTVNVV